MRKRLCALALLLAAALALGACGDSGGATAEVYRVRALESQTGGSLLATETVALAVGVDTIPAYIDAFNAAPQTAGLENPVPESAALTGGSLADGTLTLEAKGGYRTLSGIALTRANACVVLTFSAIPGVERVTIRSGDRVVCENLTAADLVLADE